MKLNLKTKFRKIVSNLQIKHREAIIKGVVEEITDSITSTVLNDSKFTSTEMAHIVITVKDNVESFLISRRENLEKELTDCTTALNNLK